jgi:hypothetical protein
VFLIGPYLDNPYLSAQNFINQEMINQDFLEEIAKFIIKSVAPVEIGQQQMQDIPFTSKSNPRFPFMEILTFLVLDDRYIPPAYRNTNRQLKHLPHVRTTFH